MESWEAVTHAGITLAVAMAIARALLHGICEEDKVRQREGREGGGERGLMAAIKAFD